MFPQHHSIDHFPPSVSYDSCFTSVHVYSISYHYSSTCQEVEELWPSLMVMSSPHYLDKSSEYDRIQFSLRDSHPNFLALIGIFSSHRFKVFQEDFSKFYHPIYNCLQPTYLANPYANNNL